MRELIRKLNPTNSLAIATTIVAAVAFVLSYVGLYDAGLNVLKLPREIAWTVPVGIDGFQLCGVAATFALRNAEWRVRAYAWLIFSGSILLSIAGQVLHAQSKGLALTGIIGSAIWPVLLAAASHLLIIVKRHEENYNNAPANKPIAAKPIDKKILSNPKAKEEDFHSNSDSNSKISEDIPYQTINPAANGATAVNPTNRAPKKHLNKDEKAKLISKYHELTGAGAAKQPAKEQLAGEFSVSVRSIERMISTQGELI